MISELVEMKYSVWPSGAAVSTSRPAGMKLPPALFSTMTFMPMLALIFCATSRAVTSVPPPARQRDDQADRLAGLQLLRLRRLGSANAAASRQRREPDPSTMDVIAASLIVLSIPPAA